MNSAKRMGRKKSRCLPKEQGEERMEYFKDEINRRGMEWHPTFDAIVTFGNVEQVDNYLKELQQRYTKDSGYYKEMKCAYCKDKKTFMVNIFNAKATCGECASILGPPIIQNGNQLGKIDAFTICNLQTGKRSMKITRTNMHNIMQVYYYTKFDVADHEIKLPKKMVLLSELMQYKNCQQVLDPDVILNNTYSKYFPRMNEFLTCLRKNYRDIFATNGHELFLEMKIKQLENGGKNDIIETLYHGELPVTFSLTEIIQRNSNQNWNKYKIKRQKIADKEKITKECSKCKKSFSRQEFTESGWNAKTNRKKCRNCLGKKKCFSCKKIKFFADYKIVEARKSNGICKKCMDIE